MYGNYGWIITKNVQDGCAVAAHGPAYEAIPPDVVDRAGIPFRLLDGACNVVYEGQFSGPVEPVALQAPLAEFEEALEHGCVQIQYRQESGEWLSI